MLALVVSLFHAFKVLVLLWVNQVHLCHVVYSFTLGWGNFGENMFVHLDTAWIKRFDLYLLPFLGLNSTTIS